jgi:lipid A 3-O-deacylase
MAFSIEGRAQKPFMKEAGMYSDNDAYSSLFNDGYYTNGFTFFYKYLPTDEKNHFPKKIVEWNFSIKMYTPESGDAPRIIEQDRPFAGYLYASKVFNFFYENESFMKYGISLGIIGPSSGGGKIQSKFHKFFGIYEVEGWDYQIRDMLALNANFMYSKKVVRFCGENCDISAIADINLGTVSTNAGFGLMNRFSIYPANKIYLSGTYGSLIDKNPLKRSQRISEFFVFVKPMIYYRAYDATIQGSMFNDNSPVTYDIEPVLYSIETGIIFQLYRVNLKYSVTFNSIEVLNEKAKAQTFGTLNISYIF